LKPPYFYDTSQNSGAALIFDDTSQNIDAPSRVDQENRRITRIAVNPRITQRPLGR